MTAADGKRTIEAEVERLRVKTAFLQENRDSLAVGVTRRSAEVDALRNDVERLRTLADISVATTVAQDRTLDWLRWLLAEALDGWERAVDREHAANCFDEHDPEQCRPPRIAEIRREAGL